MTSIRGRWSWIAFAALALACGGADTRNAAPAGNAGTGGVGTASGTASTAGTTDTTTARPTVLFLGTSLTAGLGLDPDDAYPALIRERIDSLGLNYRVVNAGVSGETSAAALRRVDWLLRQPVEVVVVETGANDGLRGLTVDSMRTNVREIIRKIRATHPRARIVLVQMEAPPNLGRAYTDAYRNVFPELAREENVTLAPFLLEGVSGVDTLNQADGIHPNEAGSRKVAENIWPVLARELRGSGS